MPDPVERAVDPSSGKQNVSLDDVLRAIDHLMLRFRVERFCYLACALIAVGLLTWSVVRTLVSDGLEIEQMGALFGSTGLFGVTSVGVLYMFRQAFKLVDRVVGGGTRQ